MPHKERRPAGNRAAMTSSGDVEATIPREVCTLCRIRPAATDVAWCRTCYRDVIAGIRRRREAALRLIPLADGRRDTLEPTAGAGGRR